MPEASRLAQGVKKIGDDATRVFGRATKTMGAQMASSVAANSRKVVDSLRDVEKFTAAAAKAKKADADAAGRLELALKKLKQVNDNAKSTDLQRASAIEGVNRATRTQELTTSNLTRVTKQLTAAQKAQQAAQDALKNPVETKLPLGARLAAQAEQYGTDSGTRFISGFKRALGAGAALAVGGGFLAAAKQAIDLGVGMESNLNRLQGVTNATAQEMAQATAVAKQLGADTTIVGASAADAAAAMLELAKGGLTMQQALAAAPGTLRLAAAAQIDAATAAESQAAILNSFQLMPDQADRVADALANVANAAAGEVPDFMLGLQQAATVAHGFGISMEDTVSVLGLFAKAGLVGSDAGTSFKTMLTHLANPSDQAAGAMADLGLNIHTASGEFVGMRELFKQIGEASARMRPDDFQQSVAKLFGTDAIRGAMIAGKQGTDTLDQMAESVRTAGGATRMAASNMQGLPGTLEKLSNSADTARLSLYELVKPMLQSGGEKGVEWLNKAAEYMDNLKKGGGGSAVDLIAAGWRDISGAVKDIAPVLGQVVAQFARGAGATVITGWRALGLAMKVIEPPLKFIAEIFTAIPGLGTGVAALLTAMYLKSKLAGPALTAAAKATELWGKAFDGWKSPAKQAADAMDYVNMATGEAERSQRGFVTQVRDAYRSSAGEADRFKRSAGVAGGAMSAMKSAGAGVLGLLGGPWGAAALGVTAAMAMISKAHEDAAAKAEEQRQREQALLDTLDKQTGAITDATRERVKDALVQKDPYGNSAAGRAMSYGLDPSVLLDAATGTGDPQAYDALRQAALQKGVMPGLQGIQYAGAGGQQINWASIQKDMASVGVTTEDLQNALLHQGNAWDMVSSKLRQLPGAANGSSITLQKLIDEMPDVNESIITLTQNVNDQRNALLAANAMWEQGNAVLNGTWKATQAGIDAFKALGAAILSVPNDHTIMVEAPDIDKVRGQFEQTGATVTQIPGTKMVVISADTDAAKAALKDLVIKVEDANPLLQIGADTAQATDALDAWKRIITGQPPVNIPVTPKPSNAGDVILPPAFRPPGGAAGGRVVGDIIRGPGSGTSDSILAQATNGQLLRVANGESINTEASTRRHYPLIQAMNRGLNLTRLIGLLPKFARGGWATAAVPSDPSWTLDPKSGTRFPTRHGPLWDMPDELPDAAGPNDPLVPYTPPPGEDYPNIWGPYGPGEWNPSAPDFPRPGDSRDIFHRNRRGISSFATGGRMIRGPGSGTSDSILGLMDGQKPILVSNGESINTEASTRRNWPLIDAMNRGWTPSPALLRAITGIRRYSEGGLLDYAESIVGTPYSQATRWDCSGTVARLVNQATGMGGGDLMTTKNAAEWLAARGFVEGVGGPDDFSVGWYDHGGGPNSGHMAATLPGGVNAEQGGKNGAFMLGGDAAGADSPQFDRHMYLPADALWPEGSGGGGGGSSIGSGGGSGGYSSQSAKSTAVTKAENDLKQADRTVAEKEARLAEVNAKAKATDSEKMRAENQLTKAKEDREEKKAKLDEARNKPVGKGDSKDGTKNGDASSFGQDLMKGALQALGFDGEIFSDPTQWGIFKFGTSMANIFGGVMKNWNWEGFADATDGGKDLGRPLRGPLGDQQHGLGGSPGPGNFGVGDGGLGGFDFGDGGGADLSAVGDTLLPQSRDTLANSQDPAPVPPTGLAPSVDASININGNVGMSPDSLFSRINSEKNARTRTYSSGLPK